MNDGVVGTEMGEVKTFTILPKDAYGHYIKKGRSAFYWIGFLPKLKQAKKYAIPKAKPLLFKK